MPSSSWAAHCCSGCWRACGYGSFKDFEPNNFSDAIAVLRGKNDDPETWSRGFKKCARPGSPPTPGDTARLRRYVLGKMMEAKKAAWENFTGTCPYWGEDIGPRRLFGSPEIKAAILRHCRVQRPRNKVIVLDEHSGTVFRVRSRPYRRARKYNLVWLTGLSPEELPRNPEQLPLPLNNHVVSSGMLSGTNLGKEISRPLARTLNRLWAERRTAPPLAHVEEEVPF